MKKKIILALIAMTSVVLIGCTEAYYSGRETGVQKTDDQYLEMFKR